MKNTDKNVQKKIDVTATDMPCPCGLDKALASCCLPLIQQEQQAETAEALMRSRYTAYAMGNMAYLTSSWHAATRPATVEANSEIEWLGLTVLSFRAGGTADLKGNVEFIARYRAHNALAQVHENSRFIKEQGQWFYLDGDLIANDVGRNSPCPCGSGKKFKKCCGQ